MKGDCIVNAANVTTPVLLIHGTADDVVQVQQSVQLHDSLIAHGKSTQLVLFPGAMHNFDVTYNIPNDFTPAGLIVRDSVSVFLRRTLVRTDAAGPVKTGLPSDLFLDQNYPNRFNPTTTIRCGLPHRSDATLTVYNTLSQIVTTLLQETQEAGYHEVKFHGSGLASEVYFYRLEAGDFVETRELLLLRPIDHMRQNRRGGLLIGLLLGTACERTTRKIRWGEKCTQLSVYGSAETRRILNNNCLGSSCGYESVPLDLRSSTGTPTLCRTRVAVVPRNRSATKRCPCVVIATRSQLPFSTHLTISSAGSP